MESLHGRSPLLSDFYTSIIPYSSENYKNHARFSEKKDRDLSFCGGFGEKVTLFLRLYLDRAKKMRYNIKIINMFPTPHFVGRSNL